MKKLLILLTLMLLFAGCACGDEAMYVDGLTADRVHLRAAPSMDAESLGLYFGGAQAEVLAEEGDWLLVRLGAETGWMQSRYLSGADAGRALPVYWVRNDSSTWVNLRNGPTMDAAVLTRVENDTRVHLLGETASGWSWVETGGQRGYIVTDFLEQGFDVSRTHIVGTTGEGENIHAFTARNGQVIYFVALETEPPVVYEDVNFDGTDDIVAYTAMGASNFFCEFFVWNGAEYVRAEHTGIDYGLCNYMLHPETGIVHSGANNGFAGALHEDCLFCWEGTSLRLIRRAVSEEWTETAFSGEAYTQVTHSDVLHMRVWDYTLDPHGGTLIWERIMPLREADEGDIFTEEHDALWQGI